MIPVLGVPYINRSDLFLEMVLSIDEPIGDIVVIDNSADGTCPQIDDAHHIRMFRNIGVAAAWNLIIKSSPKAPWWAFVNSDIRFGPGDLAKLAGAMHDHDFVLLSSMACFGISQRGIQTIGWFDEIFMPAYCLVPETPVLTDDLRWLPIGDVSVGDGLVGVDEGPGREQRRFRRSFVTETKTRRAECVRLTLEDDRQVICTLDHRWLAKTPLGGMAWDWRTTASLRPGWRLQVPLDTWKPAQDFGEGWLAGMLDGEGCSHHTRRMSGISISQKEGPVLDRIFRELQAMGIPYTWRLRKPQDGHDPVAQVEVSSRRKAMELIGRLRPERLMRPELWDGRSPRSRLYSNAVPIRDIENVGEADVVTIETTAGTFIANGITSHNCEDNDFVYRARLLGIEPHFEPGGYAHYGSATIKSDTHMRDENNRTYEQNVSEYIRKWGGIMGKEVYTTPYDKGGSPRDCKTLDMERLNDLSWT